MLCLTGKKFNIVYLAEVWLEYSILPWSHLSCSLHILHSGRKKISPLIYTFNIRRWCVTVHVFNIKHLIEECHNTQD